MLALAKECGLTLTKRSRAWLCELAGTYGAEWVCAAIERGARRGKCTIGYVQGILSSWKAAGGMDEAGAGRQSKRYWGHFAGERTYTPAEDAAIFEDLFAQEG